MLLATLAAPLVLVLAARPPPASGPATPLPRSSIAAVLAHRGELGLTDEEVARLEARDAVLQAQIGELRQRLANPASPRAAGRSPDGRPAAPDEGRTPPVSPGAEEPGPAGGGRRRDGHHGEARSGAPADPAARAAALQSRIDDADTAAYLAAERMLEAPHRERAREIAERYREALADERERSGHR